MQAIESLQLHLPAFEETNVAPGDKLYVADTTTSPPSAWLATRAA